MPVVKLKPVVDASVIVPCTTDSVREFEALPAVPPLKLMALPLIVEKTSDLFWSSVPEGRSNRRRAERGHRENRSRGSRQTVTLVRARKGQGIGPDVRGTVFVGQAIESVRISGRARHGERRRAVGVRGEAQAVGQRQRQHPVGDRR